MALNPNVRIEIKRIQNNVKEYFKDYSLEKGQWNKQQVIADTEAIIV